MKVDYHEFREVFEYNGKKYRPTSPCVKCALRNDCLGQEKMYCDAQEREDHIEVIYEEVKDSKSKLVYWRQLFISMIYSLCFTLCVTAGLFVLMGRERIWLPFGIACVITYLTNCLLIDKISSDEREY